MNKNPFPDYSSNKPHLGPSHVLISYATNEIDVQKLTIDMLSRELNTRRVVGFVGSGVTRAYGYPSWKEFAHTIVKMTLERFKNNRTILSESNRVLLQTFLNQDASETPRITPGDDTLIVLDECRSSFERAQKQADLHTTLRDLFKKKRIEKKKADNLDPLKSIIRDLGIRRFVTTNYDLEIESAFVRLLSSPLPESLKRFPGIPETFSSSDQIGPHFECLHVDPEEAEALTQFAIGSPGYERGVFHCHGIAHRPESAIISERDYQRIYLYPEPRHIAYREAFELVFSANPILFLGLGMQETDILRPLRQFVSERRNTLSEKPFFAIMQQPGDKASAIRLRKFLYSRYGVKVIFHSSPDDKEPQNTDQEKSDARTRTFCNFIRKLSTDHQKWWQDWQSLPPIRRSYFQLRRDGKSQCHHLEILHDGFFETSRNDENLLNAIEAKKEGGLIVVSGAQGAAKGSLGIRLFNGELAGNLLDSSFDKRFFATMKFTNDFLSIIESASAFLLKGKDDFKAMPPLLRFEQALNQNRTLIILGGVERLLKDQKVKPVPPAAKYPQIDPPTPAGNPITPEIAKFFSLVRSPKATVVLITSLWPSWIPTEGHLVEAPGVELLSITSSFSKHIYKKDEHLAEDIFHCLNGHAYALAVVLRQLENLRNKKEATRWLQQLHGRLMAIGESQRPEAVISATIERLEDQRLLAALYRVALFTTPVTPDIIDELVPTQRRRTLSEPLEVLWELGLVCKVSKSRDIDRPRYTAHTLVRAYVLHLIGASIRTPGEPQRFILSDYAKESEEPQSISEEAHILMTSSIDRLLDRLEELVAIDQGQNPSGSKHSSLIRSQARAVFGMIRARWNSLTLCELSAIPATDLGGRSHYDAYQNRLGRLASALKQAGLDFAWHGLQVSDPDKIESEEGLLYAEELSWLYNELGLSAFCKGQLHDAHALWTLDREINIATERGEGIRALQSSLNLAVVQIERGNLQRARTRIETLLNSSVARGDAALLGRLWGYFGWIHHLSADFTRAQEYYEFAIDILESERITRGLSIFHRLRGDLNRWLGNDDGARADLRKCLAAAELGRHFDLANFGRISQAHLEMGQRDVNSVIDRIMAFSRRMGLPKLEADCAKVQGEISLRTGDLFRARRNTWRSLALSARHGMRLRLTSILALMGRIEKKDRNQKGAIALLDAAVRRGRSQGYQLQVENIEKHLRELGTFGVS